VSDAPKHSDKSVSGPGFRLPGNHAPEVLFVDLNAAQAALGAVETSTPRLAADEDARYEDMLQRGNSEAPLWRSAHIALRIALERHAGPGVRRVPYVIDPGGRPRLAKAENLTSTPHFNLSHAGGYALIAISHAGPIGVDIEVARAIAMSADRRQRIEAAAALLAPHQPLPQDADARFLQSWVRLEAAAKASGQGIGQILTEARVAGVQSNVSETAPQLTTGRQSTLASAGPVLDIKLPEPCFAAVAGAQCSSLLAVEAFPNDAELILRFSAAAE
jgi:4'-phosphopantetheinyl transferase